MNEIVDLVPIYKKGLVYDWFSYYRLNIRFSRPVLATCPAANIHEKHIIEKSKKEIAKVKKLSEQITKASEAKLAQASGKKLPKSLEKYAGSEISDKKKLEELKGIIRSYMALTGLLHDLPDDEGELLKVAKEVEEDFNDKVKTGEAQSGTVFMTDKNGKAILSPHMILGFIKSVTSIVVNSTSDSAKKALKEGSKGNQKNEDGDDDSEETSEDIAEGETKPITTKKSVSEIFALDVKWIEKFMYPDRDILRLPEGGHVIKLHNCEPEAVERIVNDINELCAKQGILPGKLVPALLERPLLTEQQGKKQATIAMSQILPAGTKMTVHLRIRKKSPINNYSKLLETFIYGKNQGIGQWRGSGGFGAFDFQLFEVANPRTIEVIQGEDEGWM